MEIRLKAKTPNGVEGLKTLEKHSRGIMLKRLIKSKWLDDSTLEITNQTGVFMQNHKNAKVEMEHRLRLYLSTVCRISEQDYEIEE